MSLGRHIVVDLFGVDPSVLRNEAILNHVFSTALNSSGVTILQMTSHKFPGEGGVTGLFLLSESHASYHSYPEYGYVAIDVFTCGSCNPQMIVSGIVMALKAERAGAVMVSRGDPVSVVGMSASKNGTLSAQLVAV